MKILITGAQGFVGKNLAAELKNRQYSGIMAFDVDTDPVLLDLYCREADFVFHLAGVNRPQNPSEFMAGNSGFTSTLLQTLKHQHNTCPVAVSSSTQAALDNPYGRSKKAGEDLLFAYARETGARVMVYRFPNIFGKWSRPDYNSAIATFCNNIARDLPITVHDPDTVLNLVYIDDVVNELINALLGRALFVGDFCQTPAAYAAKLGDIVDMIHSFRQSRHNRFIPDLADQFVKNLYSTYLSFLPEDQFSYPLNMNIDQRGSFTEFIKTCDRGQISVNISRPGIIRGNHWHQTKNEKFLVVSGNGIIRLRQVNSSRTIEHHVRGEALEVVEIPAGFAHNIENTGNVDLVTIMWASEPYDPEKPDTYHQEV